MMLVLYFLYMKILHPLFIEIDPITVWLKFVDIDVLFILDDRVYI